MHSRIAARAFPECPTFHLFGVNYKKESIVHRVDTSSRGRDSGAHRSPGTGLHDIVNVIDAGPGGVALVDIMSCTL